MVALNDVLSRKADYTDAFERETGRPVGSPREVLERMFAPKSRVVLALLRLRDLAVRPFGITGSGLYAEDGSPKGWGFPVDTPQEAVLCQNDRHLAFTVSALVLPAGEGRVRVRLTTRVYFHNRFGKVYFFFVRPFHRILVPRLLRQVLEEGSGPDRTL